MTPVTRSLTGPLLTFDLEAQLGELRSEPAYQRSGRTGRTLAKEGPLRLTLVALAEGAEVETHHTEFPMTLLVLSGSIGFRIGKRSYELGDGEILYFGPGDAHDIRASEDTAILLTIAVSSEDRAAEA